MCQIDGKWQTATLSTGTAASTQVVTSGASYSRTYQCDATRGWVQIGSTGTCGACVPVTSQKTVEDCNMSNLDGFWEGHAVKTLSRSCPSGAETVSYDTTACHCVAGMQTERRYGVPTDADSDTARYTTISRPWTCDSDTAGHWGAWNVTAFQTGPAANCTGGSGSFTYQMRLDCPEGYAPPGNTGRTMVKTYTCNGIGSASETPWTQLSNTCTCDSTAFQTRTASCPSGQNGIIEQKRTFNCTAGRWGMWQETKNSCAAASKIYKPASARNGSGTTPLAVSAGQTCATAGAQAKCSTPSGTGYTYYDICICSTP
jgi:hypothetical protein